MLMRPYLASPDISPHPPAYYPAHSSPTPPSSYVTTTPLRPHVNLKIKPTDSLSAPPSSRSSLDSKQLATLERIFLTRTQNPTPFQRELLGAQNNLSARTIQIWFQNRRAKERREKDRERARVNGEPAQLESVSDEVGPNDPANFTCLYRVHESIPNLHSSSNRVPTIFIVLVFASSNSQQELDFSDDDQGRKSQNETLFSQSSTIIIPHSRPGSNTSSPRSSPH